MRIRGASVHRSGGAVARFSFDGIHSEHPYMLALSQSTTERLLAEALSSSGVTVERSVELVDCWASAESVRIGFSAGGAAREQAHAPWRVAADGVHSVARERLGIGFRGRRSSD